MSASETTPSTNQQRVQKILAQAGISSRRKAEELIIEGSVTINGATAKLGDKADITKDAIKVNGKLLQGVEDKVYLAFYKPRAVISMLVDNENRPNLTEYLRKVSARVFPVGRLDFNSEGLLLLTNDGDFAEKMQRRDDVARVYTVKVKGHVTPDQVKRLERGGRLEERMVRPHSVRILKELDNKTQLQIVIQGGGAIDIRALCEIKGLLVDKITRTAIGHLTLHGLLPGHYRELKDTQAMALLEQPELGLQRLEREIEDDRPKGQRNFHEKKADVSDDFESSEEAVEVAAVESPAPMRRRGAAAAVKPLETPAPQREWTPRESSDRPSFGDKRPGGFNRGPRRDFGDRPSFGDKRPGGFNRGPRRDFGDRPSFGDKRPGGFKRDFGGEGRPSFGDKRPGGFNRGPRRDFGGEGRPSFGDKRPAFGADRPSFGDKRPGGFGFKRGPRPDFGGEGRPSFGDKRPGGFGAKRPSFGSDRPRFGADRPSFGDKRPGGFGFKRGPRPDFAGEGRPSFGTDRPSFGDKRPGGFGAKRPSFGGGRPSFGDKRPGGFGAKRFGAGRPSFGDKPRSGNAGAGAHIVKPLGQE